MEEAATVACLFLFHVAAMVKAYRDQVLELGVVIYVHDPNSCRQRPKDTQSETLLSDTEKI